MPDRNIKSRFCNDDLNDLKKHFHPFYMDKSASNCAACGQRGAYWIVVCAMFTCIGKQKGRQGSARLPVLQIITTNQCLVC